MQPFAIIAVIILVINTIFLFGSLVYTVKTAKRKDDPRLSSLGSVLGSRLSLQPQVIFYDAIVRMSGNPSLKQEQINEKLEK